MSVGLGTQGLASTVPVLVRSVRLRLLDLSRGESGFRPIGGYPRRNGSLQDVLSAERGPASPRAGPARCRSAPHRIPRTTCSATSVGGYPPGSRAPRFCPNVSAIGPYLPTSQRVRGPISRGSHDTVLINPDAADTRWTSDDQEELFVHRLRQRHHRVLGDVVVQT